MNYPLIIVIIIIIAILIFALKSEANDIYKNTRQNEIRTGNGKIHYKGLGTEDESIETLLNRIYWVADSDGRNGKWKRSYIIAFIATLAIICAIYHRVPSAKELVLLILTIFITVIAITAFFRFHSDRFAPYYIRRNIKYIQSKLNVTTKDPGPPPKKVIPPDYAILDVLLR